MKRFLLWWNVFRLNYRAFRNWNYSIVESVGLADELTRKQLKLNTNEEPTWIAVDEGLEYFEHPHPFRVERKNTWSTRTLKTVQDGHGTLNPLLKLLKDTSKEDKTK